MNYVVMDSEFQDLGKKGNNRNSLYQLSAVKVVDNEVEYFNEYTKPIFTEALNIDSYIQKLTGITKEKLETEGKDMEATLTEFNNFVEDLPLFVWGSSDNKVINREYLRTNIEPKFKHRIYNVQKIVAKELGFVKTITKCKKRRTSNGVRIPIEKRVYTQSEILLCPNLYDVLDKLDLNNDEDKNSHNSLLDAKNTYTVVKNLEECIFDKLNLNKRKEKTC